MREANELHAGLTLFMKIGCASCHAPSLGQVDGLYSDLLLHDLGPALGDVGQYGVFDPSSSEDEIIDDTSPIADAKCRSNRRGLGGVLRRASAGDDGRRRNAENRGGTGTAAPVGGYHPRRKRWRRTGCPRPANRPGGDAGTNVRRRTAGSDNSGPNAS